MERIQDQYAIELNEEAQQAYGEINLQLRAKLKQLREEGKITMNGLVRLSGVSSANLREWYRGDHFLEKYETIWRVAKVLGFKLTMQ